jgi:hypothetical protein
MRRDLRELAMVWAAYEERGEDCSKVWADMVALSLQAKCIGYENDVREPDPSDDVVRCFQNHEDAVSIATLDDDYLTLTSLATAVTSPGPSAASTSTAARSAAWSSARNVRNGGSTSSEKHRKQNISVG